MNLFGFVWIGGTESSIGRLKIYGDIEKALEGFEYRIQNQQRRVLNKLYFIIIMTASYVVIHFKTDFSRFLKPLVKVIVESGLASFLLPVPFTAFIFEFIGYAFLFVRGARAHRFGPACVLFLVPLAPSFFAILFCLIKRTFLFNGWPHRKIVSILGGVTADAESRPTLPVVRGPDETVAGGDGDVKRPGAVCEQAGAAADRRV